MARVMPSVHDEASSDERRHDGVHGYTRGVAAGESAGLPR